MRETGCVLGIALLGHDLSATVIGPDGRVVFVAEEERYSGRKGGSFVFHPAVLLEILDAHGVTADDIRHLAVAGSPNCWDAEDSEYLPFDRLARTRHLDAWERELMARFQGLSTTRRYRHHMAHAASAHLSCPWDNSAVLTFDAFGDGQVSTSWLGKGRVLKPIGESSFPHSVPYLYRAFATWLGLRGWERVVAAD